MKSIKNIALSALLTVGAFGAVTYTACNKDECKDVVCQNGGTCSGGNCTCTVGYTGTNCETDVRTLYANMYRGSGSDNAGGTYTNWALQFAPLGSTATDLSLNILDANNAPQLNFTAVLQTNTTFSISPKTSGNFSYTGTGTISTTTASLTLTEVETTSGASTTIVYTFNNMIKP